MPMLKTAQPSVKDTFVHFIRERENIRLKRLAHKPPPWTDDSILGTYRFCNVRRMDDRVSQWLMEYWYKPYRNHPNMLLACALARHFNKPEALFAIGFPLKWDPERVKHTLRTMKAQGKQIFNGAYMVRGIGTADKTEMVVDKVCQPLVDKPPHIDPTSMRKSVEALLPYWGFSSFMAGQVIADMRHAVHGTWMDKGIWAPIGPGSLRGMNRFMGRPTKQPLKQEQFLQELADYVVYCCSCLPAKLTERLEAIDWQNTLCEGDKYLRALSGEGKPKQLYRAK